MLRTVSSRTLPLSFAIVALTFFSKISPKEKLDLYPIEKLSCDSKNEDSQTEMHDPCEQPPTGTTIKEVPYDCLHKIIQFYAYLGGKSPFALRLVNKDFKNVIDNYPCCLTYINKCPRFLHYRFEPMKFFDSCVRLHNEKCVDKFVNESFLSKGSEKTFCIYVKLNEQKQAKFLPPRLKLLMSCLKAKNGELVFLKIQYHEAPGCIKVFRCEKFGQVEGMIIDKKVISNKELNMFGNVKSLSFLENTSFKNSEIKWPGKVDDLLMCKCKNFDLERLKNLPCLRVLKLNRLNKFDGNKLKDAGLKNLQTLSVLYCENFNMEGLGGLESLRKLEIDDYGELVGSPAGEPKNLHELVLNSSLGSLKKVEAKAYKIIKGAGELKNLRELRVCGNYSCLKRPDIIEALEKLEKNGTTLSLPVYEYLDDKKEKPIVLVSSSYNNNKDWYKKNLEGIFSQEYSNYVLIYDK